MTESGNCTGPQCRHRRTAFSIALSLSEDFTAVPNPIPLARGRLGSWRLQTISVLTLTSSSLIKAKDGGERGPEARLLIFWERPLYSFCLQPFSLHPLFLVHSCPSVGASTQASYLRKTSWIWRRRWTLFCVFPCAAHELELPRNCLSSLWRPDVTVTQFSVQSHIAGSWYMLAGMFPFLACRWPLPHGLDWLPGGESKLESQPLFDQKTCLSVPYK